MQKLSAQSKDLSQENIRKIEEIFPNCVTETYDQDGNLVRSIDFDILRQDLSDHVVEGPKERYQFNWPGKREAILLANAPTTNTLRPLPEKSVDFENTKNVYIEGDNLEALKILRETYMGKIKMIYIDPPYNTGNDFVYKDDFKQSTEEYLKSSGDIDEEGNRMEVNGESNGRFHSDWLNMMYPRLALARDLLTDDGVIFISIDDNEYENIKKACNEIFGTQNFVSNLIWQKKTGASDASAIATITEYILVYIKNFSMSQFAFAKNQSSFDLQRYKYKDEFYKERGPFYLDNLDRGGLQYSDSLNFGIECPDGTYTFPNGRSKYENDGWIWKWSKSKIQWAIKNKFIVFRKTEKKRSGWAVCYKNYLKVDNENKPITRSAPFKNLITDVLNADASKNIKDLFNGNNIFPYSKPVDLIKKIQDFVNNDNGIVLDFFSGSATTGQAVVENNFSKSKHNRFILVQMPEKCSDKQMAVERSYSTICDIGEERLRKFGIKLHEDNPLTIDNLDCGFRVFKVDSSNLKNVLSTPKETQLSLLENADSAIKPDRNPLDLVTQVMLQLGITLDADIKIGKFACGRQFYAVNGNDLVCCFDKNVSESDIEEIAKMQPLNVAFRDDSFASDQDEVNCEQIFKTLSPITGKNIFVL